MMVRNTRQRTAIRSVFQASGRPLSPEEVLSAAQRQVGGIGAATVYRNIRALLDEGWLAAVELPGEAPRYELAGKAHHHHFHCRQCGRVFELPECDGCVRAQAPRGFRVTGHEIVLYGDCSQCASAV